MAEKKMVLFDWNGTLLDDILFWEKSVAKVFEAQDITMSSALFQYFLENLGVIGSATEAYRAMGIMLPKERIREIYRNEYKNHLEKVWLSPGVKEVLDILKRRKIITGIITAQYSQLFDPIFLRLKLKPYFKHVVSEADKKSAVISHLCFLEGVSPGNCYYVGDMPSDVCQANMACARSVAYLTKYIQEELFWANNPDFSISDLRELLEIVK